MRILALLLATAAAAAATDGAIAMTGTYSWNNAKKKDQTLAAEFTPAGKNEWTVQFTARWKGKDEVYSGTAQGDPRAGAVTGKAKEAKGKRTWTFVGKVESGELVCKHAEVANGKEQPSGEFRVRSAAP